MCMPLQIDVLGSQGISFTDSTFAIKVASSQLQVFTGATGAQITGRRRAQEGAQAGQDGVPVLSISSDGTMNVRDVSVHLT